MGTSWLTYIQIALNAFLIVLLVIVVLRRPKEQEKIKSFLMSMEEIAKDHEVISGQFHKNLEEKRQIILELSDKLENQIKKAEEVIQKLERMIKDAQVTDHSSFRVFKNPEHEQIISLLKQGFTAQTIARQLQKSVGEIELVINLYKTIARKK